MIRVLVVDDSALIRDVLTKMLSRDGDIEVVGSAEDPIAAREKIKRLNPDVLTLDIEMPQMNGLAFLDKLMRLRPMPVVMVSTLTQKGADETLLALELGAVDFIAKPGAQLEGGIERFGQEVRAKVRAAADSKGRLRGMTSAPGAGKAVAISAPEGSLIAIGASTGGVDAVRAVLEKLPANCPPVVIGQHMPAGFTKRFASRLNEQTGLNVCEAEDRMLLKSGCAYVAPGGFHLSVEKSSGQLKCRVSDDAEVSGHKPSVDVLFGSVAKVMGPMAVGAILTGMGRDGATGLKLMRDAGAYTVGQSASSALVYGMPKVAFEEGAVVEQAGVEAIAGKLATALNRIKKAA